jgi:RHS repeat-associated protein
MVDNRYDHRHRRCSKTVRRLTGRGAGYPFDPSQGGAWDVVATHTFIYDGWNLVRETVSHADGVTDVFDYFWGLDISGTLQGAGGVGGLLAVRVNNNAWYFPLYDNNGNVTDYVDAAGNIRAHYEYSPFGEIVVQSGDLADTFRFRFSTKYWDEETRSYYYGYRHYAPKLGCWLSKDPIGERGGLNEYGFVDNDPINICDTLGLMPATTWGGGGLGGYAQLLTALIDFLNGGPPVTYNYEYPDSVTKRLLKHPAVKPAWKTFKAASCAGKGAGYPKTITVKHEARTLDFFVDIRTLWGIFNVFGDINTQNVNFNDVDIGIRILGSFGGLATVSVDCNTCERKLVMTLEDSFTVTSMLRNPFNRKPTIKTPFLNPVKMIFNYEIKEKIQ